MNTPAHIATSVLVWRKEAGWGAASAVTFGAILPDAPMFGFYAYQRFVAKRPENEIWSTLYFDNNWQLFFDAFNSIPFLLALIGLCYLFGFRWGLLLGSSALLHVCCDLPVHHDDAHRHFLPLTNWRFESPVSYWDPKHFGLVFSIMELTFAVTTCIYVGCRGLHFPMRTVAFCTLALYVAFITFALIMWVPQLA